jgi:hypothetical protein
MTMNTRKTVLATMLAAFAAAPLALVPMQAQAQIGPGLQTAPAHLYSQAELDQMLAPIALYPDPLLSQVLMAATYPIEVSEAARWSRANPGLTGDEAVRAVQNEDWDPSVKSLVAFPEILQRMDEKREWTRALGDAFLAQEPQMMDEVQNLRRRAQAAGNLRSDERIVVQQRGPVIVVEPASPEYVYVPYYDPLVMYGPWWYPAYPPVSWSPWPGYVRPYYRPGISVGFWWGRPIGVSLGFFFGDFDWGRRYTRVSYANSYYYRQPSYPSRYFSGSGDRWYHDSFHRRGIDYRNASVRQRYANEAYVLGQQSTGTSRFAPQTRQSTQTFTPQTRQSTQTFTPQTRQSSVIGQPPAASAEWQAQREARRQALQPQAQPQVQPQWQERRWERREMRQAQPQAQVQPQRQEQRWERREMRQAQPQAQPQPQFQRLAPQAPQGGGYVLGQHPREQRAAMPPAVAQQAPRQEQRQERREARQAAPKDQPQAQARGGVHILGQ